MTIALANIAATPNDLTTYDNIEFSTLAEDITYFGLTESERNNATAFILQYLTDNSMITLYSGDQFTGTIDASSINDDSELQYILNRCEKVMIKDEIATEDGLTDIKQRKYLGSIYMPNDNILIASSILTVVSENESQITKTKLIQTKNGEEDVITEYDATADEPIFNGIIVPRYIEEFNSIDKNNISVFAGENGEGISLFDALKIGYENGKDYSGFFTKNSDGIYTWKPTDSSLFFLEFDWDVNDETFKEFIFSDFELVVG